MASFPEPFDRDHVDPSEEPKLLDDWWHVHRHGVGTPYEHEHTHRHEYYIGGQHGHGFHSRYWGCSGDDTFGDEAGPKLPSGYVGEQLAEANGLQVFIPYVPGMLQVVDESLWFVPRMEVDVSRSQYDYWDLICSLAERGKDFVIIEHDMVVPAEAPRALLECPEPWCGHNYQTMRPNYETGTHEMRGIYEEFGHLGPLGLVCFKQPAVDWIGLVLRGWGPVTWGNLDTKVYQALKVPIPPATEGLTCHRHYPDAGHLHDYPELRAHRAQSEPPVAEPSGLSPEGSA